MKLKIDFKKLRNKSDDLRFFLLDVVMILLAVVYLCWTLIDLLLRTDVVSGLIFTYTSESSINDFYLAYTSIDPIFYDSVFVSIFLGELLIRWAIAIRRKTYHRWFFYPFVHWYDTLGCIPVTSFKFFRIIRIFAILYRLHKMEMIDLKNSYLYKKGTKYLNILTEEISDRVVVNVIGEVQNELEMGNPVIDRILEEVIRPQKAALVEWLSQRIQQATSEAHLAYHADIKNYIDTLIEDAVEQNREISLIEKIPVVGSNISQMLESAISDIVFRVINQALQDLGSPNNKVMLDDVADFTLNVILQEGEDKQLNQLAKDIANQSLEVVKDHVKIQQWKVREKQMHELGLDEE
ncbi:MAG: hypothetical protein ACPGJS_14865 [Flammeovirgaceae bacterium]